MFKVEVIETSAGPAKLKRTGRRTLAIHVLPDGSLELTAPYAVSVDNINAKVEKRSRWIASQRLNFMHMSINLPQRRFVEGATHRYLGKQYRLKINWGDETRIKLKGAFFEITTPKRDPANVEKILTKWFRDRSVDQFARRMEFWKPWCKKHLLPEPSIQIRHMSRRWGSTGSGGKILLNPLLIHAPSRCIDYVIAHEVCHLRHPAHNRSFYRLLSALLPDWEKLKKRLEESECY